VPGKAQKEKIITHKMGLESLKKKTEKETGNHRGGVNRGGEIGIQKVRKMVQGDKKR